MKIYLILFLLLVPVSHAQTDKPLVIVSIPPQKEFISAITGSHFDIEIMLSPGESPETFSPSPRRLISLSRASIYFQAGVPFERHWTGKLSGLNPEMKVITCCDQIVKMSEEFRPEDMHYWTDPLFVQRYIKLVYDKLLGMQPEISDDFGSNYHKYLSALLDLDGFISSSLKNRDINDFIISHSALDSYSSRYGLTQHSLEQGGKESGPMKISKTIDIARQSGIKSLFVIEQYRTRAVDNMAKIIGAKLVYIDPLAEDYLANMRVITRLIAVSLKN